MMLSMTRFVILEDKLNSKLGFLGIKKTGSDIQILFLQ